MQIEIEGEEVRARAIKMKGKVMPAERPPQWRDPRCNKGSKEMDPKGPLVTCERQNTLLGPVERFLRSLNTVWEQR